MKKKVIGILLALMLITTMMPAAVFADETSATAENGTTAITDVTADNEVKSDNQLLADQSSETDDTDEITEITPGEGGSGTLDSTTKSKEYTIKLTESGRLTVNIYSEILLLKVAIKDSDDNKISSDIMSKGDKVYKYDLTSGTYTLEFSSINKGNFEFETLFESAKETYTDNNDSIYYANKLDAVQFGNDIYGQIALNDECDYYKFVLDSSGKLTINIRSDIEEVKLYLQDENGNSVVSEVSMEEGNRPYGYDLAAGTYFFGVERTSGNTGTYSFNMVFTPSGETYTEKNDTVNLVRNTDPVTLGSMVIGQIAENDEFDYYRIVIPAKCKYLLKVDSEIEKVKFYLYDSDEKYVSDTAGNESYGHSKGAKNYYYVLEAGTYYLGFERSSSNTGVYEFKIKPYLTKPTTKGVSSAKKAFTVKWKKVSYAQGYEVQYSLKKNMKSAKKVTITKASTVSKKIKKLKSKKTYYVRVRAYKTVDGTKYYSAWSAKKSIKTK